MDLLPENIESFSIEVQLRKYTKNSLIYIMLITNTSTQFFLRIKAKTIQYVLIGSRGKDSKSMYAHSLSLLDVLD